MEDEKEHFTIYIEDGKVKSNAIVRLDEDSKIRLPDIIRNHLGLEEGEEPEFIDMGKGKFKIRKKSR